VASASRAAQASRDAYRVSSDGREASVPMKDHRDIVGVTITTRFADDVSSGPCSGDV